jgi:hypothetical protein
MGNAIQFEPNSGIACDKIARMRGICVRLGLNVALVNCVLGCGGSDSTFSVLTAIPEISSVTPNPVSQGGTLTIAGTGFNGTLTIAQLTSGSGTTTTSHPSSGSTSAITVTVPFSLPAGTYTLKIVDSDSIGNLSSPSNSVSLQIQ